MKKFSVVSVTAYTLFMGVMQSANAAVILGTAQGYEASMSGSLPVFLVVSDHDAKAGSRGEQAVRIQSGFNPANITLHVKAPTTEGLTVSAHVQYDTHLQGSGTQNSGLLESRVAEIQIDGDFGSVSLGKGFGIFNSSAIGDMSSGLGVGWLGGGADTANATGGHIGTGYVYANFNPHITYTSPDMNGLKLKVGAINPEDPSGYDTKKVETSMPRIEGQLNYLVDYSRGELKFWTGFLYQNIQLLDENYDYNMRGVDVGSHLDIDGFGLTLAYTDTKGIGADGLYGFNTDGGVGINDAEVNATQWYGEADYVMGKTTLGCSYGEGQQDATVSPVGKARDITNKLGMLFVHHQLTPALTVIGEIQDYRSDAQANYNAYVVGAQFDF
jgi:predicted porin